VHNYNNPSGLAKTMKQYFIILIITLLATTALAQEMEIKLSDLTLREKIGQMMIVKGDKFDSRFLDLGIGGIFLSLHVLVLGLLC